ncbi:hypothetical protein CEE37_00170 [candidate division LCP-89 bacterium B3_LCP]|uniref:RNA-binding protein n=1 Tax=candidate division LCP-89 bacterium B3_LCP TaxID=2012998 RepID=A0A532V4J1_UNCL8|nr:MAG: hypothetical protein CEE37_00170 [candidate division LCP-89 bacterium B3_LCP]
MRKRQKGKYAKPFPYMTLADALENAVRSPKLRRYLKAAELQNKWVEVVGETVAKHASPQTLERGLLTVKADSSVWRQQLTMVKPKILEELKKKYGRYKIKEMRIR